MATPSTRRADFVQPTKKHQERHVDVRYINVGGSFFFLISVLDGFSRTIVPWELREAMKVLDVELVIARTIENDRGNSPRIMSDNGPQFIAKYFKESRAYACQDEPLLSEEQLQAGALTWLVPGRMRSAQLPINVASIVGMRSDPLRGTTRFHSDSGTTR